MKFRDVECFRDTRKYRLPKLFGTVVAERLIDMISLLYFYWLLYIFSQFGQMIGFLKQNPEIQEKLTGVITSPILNYWVYSIFSSGYLFRKAFKHTNIFKKIVAILNNFKEGFISIRTIKQKRLVLVSFRIYLVLLLYDALCYFLCI